MIGHVLREQRIQYLIRFYVNIALYDLSAVICFDIRNVDDAFNSVAPFLFQRFGTFNDFESNSCLQMCPESVPKTKIRPKWYPKVLKKQ